MLLYSLCVVLGDTSNLFVTSDGSLANLVKVVSARFFHYSVIIFPL